MELLSSLPPQAAQRDRASMANREADHGECGGKVRRGLAWMRLFTVPRGFGTEIEIIVVDVAASGNRRAMEIKASFE